MTPAQAIFNCVPAGNVRAQFYEVFLENPAGVYLHHAYHQNHDLAILLTQLGLSGILCSTKIPHNMISPFVELKSTCHTLHGRTPFLVVSQDASFSADQLSHVKPTQVTDCCRPSLHICSAFSKYLELFTSH